MEAVDINVQTVAIVERKSTTLRLIASPTSSEVLAARSLKRSADDSSLSTMGRGKQSFASISGQKAHTRFSADAFNEKEFKFERSPNPYFATRYTSCSLHRRFTQCCGDIV